MDQKYRYVTTSEAPRWACYAVAIVGLVLAILCIVSCTTFFETGSELSRYGYSELASLGGLYTTIGVFYVLASIGIIVGGVLVFVGSARGNSSMLRWTYFIGAIWCSLNSIICFMMASIINISYGGNSLPATFGLDITFGIFYLAAGIFFFAASMIQNSSKVPGLIASFTLALFVLIEFIYNMAATEFNVVALFLYLDIIFLAFLFIFITFKSGFYTKKVAVKPRAVVDQGPRPSAYAQYMAERNGTAQPSTPTYQSPTYQSPASSYRAPSPAPSPAPAPAPAQPKVDEKEKIELLKEYKELLDSGIITQEEFDQKKREIL